MSIQIVEIILGVTFKNRELLIAAMRYRDGKSIDLESQLVAHEHLEFLGDRIVGLLVAEFLVKEFPTTQRGKLAQLLGNVCSNRAFAKTMQRLQLRHHIGVGVSNARWVSLDETRTLACVYEAIVAAIYQDQGKEATAEFLLRTHLEPLRSSFVNEDLKVEPELCPKKRIINWAQRKRRPPVTYAVVPSPGDGFRVNVRSGTRKIGEGSGRTKREAEIAAARNALDNVGEHDSVSI